jgi:hypothetical protein
VRSISESVGVSGICGDWVSHRGMQIHHLPVCTLRCFVKLLLWLVR